jgi:hypothetical protein
MRLATKLEVAVHEIPVCFVTSDGSESLCMAAVWNKRDLDVFHRELDAKGRFLGSSWLVLFARAQAGDDQCGQYGDEMHGRITDEACGVMSESAISSNRVLMSQHGSIDFPWIKLNSSCEFVRLEICKLARSLEEIELAKLQGRV